MHFIPSLKLLFILWNDPCQNDLLLRNFQFTFSAFSVIKPLYLRPVFPCSETPSEAGGCKGVCAANLRPSSPNSDAGQWASTWAVRHSRCDSVINVMPHANTIPSAVSPFSGERARRRIGSVAIAFHSRNLFDLPCCLLCRFIAVYSISCKYIYIYYSLNNTYWFSSLCIYMKWYSQW